MPRRFVSKAQAGLAGLIAAGKRDPGTMGFESRAEAKEALRGTKVKGLPKRKPNRRKG